MFYCESCEISKNKPSLTEHIRWLLLNLFQTNYTFPFFRQLIQRDINVYSIQRDVYPIQWSLVQEDLDHQLKNLVAT